MKNNVQKALSKKLSQKTNSYVRVANISFTLSLLLFAIVVIFVWNQYQQIKVNFVDNEKTHAIQISGKLTDDGYTVVNGTFKTEIEQLLDSKGLTDEYECFSIYQFISMPAVEELKEQKEQTMCIISVDDIGQPYIMPTFSMKNGYLYTENPVASTYGLLLGKITVKEDGIYEEDAEYPYEIKTVDIKDTEVTYQEYDEEYQLIKGYVNYNTFCELFKNVTGEEFQADSDALDAYGMNPIKKVVVYVDDITKVEDIAKVLNKEGYGTNFVFASFDEIGDSLGTSLVVMSTISALLLLVTIIILLLAWKNYISLLSKDIGILKQMGYKNDFIKKVYSMSFGKSFLMSLVVVLLVSCVMALIILGVKQIPFILALLGLIIVLIIFAYLIVSEVFLRRVLKRNILDLIKTKTFE